MSLADLAVLAILAISAVFAFWRGLVREVLSIGAWVGAAVATYFGLPLLRPFARQYIHLDIIADMVTGLVIFLGVLVIGSIISHLLARGVRASALGPLDRSLGLLFGLARGALLVCFIFLVIEWWYPEDRHPDWIAEAKSLPAVASGAEILKGLLPENLASQGTEAADTARKQVEQAIELGTATGALGSDAGPSDGAQETDGAQSESAGPPEDSGYKDAERKDLNRLIQGTQ